jgi:flagellar motor switch protein FliN/FliY
MADEELSQDDIDNLFSGGNEDEDKDIQNQETKSSDAASKGDINPALNNFANLFNSSLEDVLKTLFSLDVVSKFIDLSIKQKDELQFDEGVFLSCKISIESNELECNLYIKKSFASIMSDLMLMGPGEEKEALEPDDLDALKEMIAQVFGSLQTAFKESEGKEISIEVTNAKEESAELDNAKYYLMNFDIAIPNIKNDIISLFAKKDDVDNAFKQKKEDEPQEVPFEDVEEIQTESPKPTRIPKNTPDNLDIILDIDLDVTIRIGEKHILIKDLLDLREGSIIELEKNIDEPMDILINDKIVAQGVVVVVGGRFGVKITNIDTKEERIKSLGE